MKKITKRDVLFFFLGIFIMFIIASVWDWTESNKALKTGSDAFLNKVEKEQIK